MTQFYEFDSFKSLSLLYSGISFYMDLISDLIVSFSFLQTATYNIKRFIMSSTFIWAPVAARCAQLAYNYATSKKP